MQLSNHLNHTHGDGPIEQGQHNAVFGQIETPRRWMQKETIKDRPPSYNKSTSVSALSSFANISIRNKESSVSPSSKLDICPKVPSWEMYEVSPGVQARLRDAHETWSYLQRDFYLPTSCKGCSTELTCIKNVDYVLCPTCRNVSPIEEGPSETRGGGLGLGFTLKDLKKWETGQNNSASSNFGLELESETI